MCAMPRISRSERALQTLDGPYTTRPDEGRVMSEQSTCAPLPEKDEVQYRDIPGCDGYRIGSDGTVWSCIAQRGLGPPKGTESYFSDRWRLMKTSRHGKTGYVLVTLRPATARITFSVHRLVLLAFVGPCPEGLEACHEDGNCENNYLTNLRWGTHQSNMDDRKRHGNLARGEKSGQAKLTEGEVLEVRRLFQAGWPKKRIARRLGVSPRCVYDVLSGRNWGWLE